MDAQALPESIGHPAQIWVCYQLQQHDSPSSTLFRKVCGGSYQLEEILLVGQFFAGSFGGRKSHSPGSAPAHRKKSLRYAVLARIFRRSGPSPKWPQCTFASSREILKDLLVQMEFAPPFLLRQLDYSCGVLGGAGRVRAGRVARSGSGVVELGTQWVPHTEPGANPGFGDFRPLE